MPLGDARLLRRSRFPGTSGCRTACSSRSATRGRGTLEATGAAQSGRTALRGADEHAPAARVAAERRLDDPDFEGRQRAMRYLLGGWQINASTFFRIGSDGRHAGQRRPHRRSRCSTIQRTPAGSTPARSRRPAPVRAARATTEQPAFRIRPKNALDTTGARLEGVFRSEPLHRGLLVLQDRPPAGS